YFLAALTTPEKDFWVNLSPYENDRIVPEAFGRTQMGQDLLEQDYILKQITASLMNPDADLGKVFWSKVYRMAYEKFGTTDIPVDTFNKVWITPDQADVFERLDASKGAAVAFVTGARLKVMLESDYIATSNNATPTGGHVATPVDQVERGVVSPSRLPTSQPMNTKATQVSTVADPTQDISKQVLREIIIPVLEKEVNEGKNFAPLRQIYYSLILAHWFKGRVKDSILNTGYADKNKILGIEALDAAAKDKIYAQYIEAFKVGAFNYIREEIDAYSGDVLPRKYFSGGFDIPKTFMVKSHNHAEIVSNIHSRAISVILDHVGNSKSPSIIIPETMSVDERLDAQKQVDSFAALIKKNIPYGPLSDGVLYVPIVGSDIPQVRMLANELYNLVWRIYKGTAKMPNLQAARELVVEIGLFTNARISDMENNIENLSALMMKGMDANLNLYVNGRKRDLISINLDGDSIQVSRLKMSDEAWWADPNNKQIAKEFFLEAQENLYKIREQYLRALLRLREALDSQVSLGTMETTVKSLADGFTVVEINSGYYYDENAGLKSAVEHPYRVIKGPDELTSYFRESPERMINVLRWRVEEGAILSPEISAAILSVLSAGELPPVSIKENEAFNQFLDVDGKISDVLVEMHRLGVLKRLFPELEEQDGHIVHPTHMFNGLFHTLFLLKSMEDYYPSLEDIANPDLINLWNKVMTNKRLRHNFRMASLLHDIGKEDGILLFGQPHPIAGSNGFGTIILKRFGFSAADSNDVRWLVWYHQSLAAWSTYFKSFPNSTIVNMLDRMNGSMTQERLDLLMLLSVSDWLSWMPPSVFSKPQSIRNMQALYNKVNAGFASDGFIPKARIDEWRNDAENEKSRLQLALKSSIEEDFISSKDADISSKLTELLAALFEYYDPVFLLQIPSDVLQIYVRMIYSLKFNPEHEVVVETSAIKNEYGLMMHLLMGLTKDTPGIFEKATGLLAALGFNIMIATIRNPSYKDGNKGVLNAMQCYLEKEPNWTDLYSLLPDDISGFLRGDPDFFLLEFPNRKRINQLWRRLENGGLVPIGTADSHINDISGLNVLLEDEHFGEMLRAKEPSLELKGENLKENNRILLEKLFSDDVPKKDRSRHKNDSPEYRTLIVSVLLQQLLENKIKLADVFRVTGHTDFPIAPGHEHDTVDISFNEKNGQTVMNVAAPDREALLFASSGAVKEIEANIEGADITTTEPGASDRIYLSKDGRPLNENEQHVLKMRLESLLLQPVLHVDKDGNLGGIDLTDQAMKVNVSRAGGDDFQFTSPSIDTGDIRGLRPVIVGIQ
ncbi:MAG: hypothetical protein HQL22_01395, partial [Candidatus Omnitrophica bacterium]|nr:hypothetical protein [Candidatus Omnitrophota bacterium]